MWCSQPATSIRTGEDARPTRLGNLFLGNPLAAVIQLIADLSSPEYAALLLQLLNLSREELLARFANSDRD